MRTADVDESMLFVLYVADGYFGSRSCMRELFRAIHLGKPIFALEESDPLKGGISRKQVFEQLQKAFTMFDAWGMESLLEKWGCAPLTPPQIIGMMFGSQQPIEWSRLGAFRACAGLHTPETFEKPTEPYTTCR